MAINRSTIHQINVPGKRSLPLCLWFVMLVFQALFPNSGYADETTQPIIVESMTTALIRQAEIAARDAGVLKTVAVASGDIVSEGDLLASLDDELQELAVRQAELNVKIAELKADNNLPVETARAQVREAEQEKVKLEIAARISQKLAESDVSVRLAEKTREVAQFELERAKRTKDAFSAAISNSELNRLQVLFDQRTLEIEKSEEDKVVATMKPETDLAAVLQQAETVERSRLLAAEREQEQQVARTNLEVARNEMALARLHLDRRRLYAPFSGAVVTISRQESEWVEPGTVVLRLIQLDKLRVEGFIGADLATGIQSGKSVTISFPQNQLDDVNGIVTFVSQEIDSINQRVQIRAEFENADHKIRPGLVATMTIEPSSTEAAGLTNSPKNTPEPR